MTTTIGWDVQVADLVSQIADAQERLLELAVRLTPTERWGHLMQVEDTSSRVNPMTSMEWRTNEVRLSAPVFAYVACSWPDPIDGVREALTEVMASR